MANHVVTSKTILLHLNFPKKGIFAKLDKFLAPKHSGQGSHCDCDPKSHDIRKRTKYLCQTSHKYKTWGLVSPTQLPVSLSGFVAIGQVSSP